jgi:hypothetical protein
LDARQVRQRRGFAAAIPHRPPEWQGLAMAFESFLFFS